MPTHGSVAQSVRLSKEANPTHYCPARNCLWRTYDARTNTFKGCPKGAGHGLHPDVKKTINTYADGMTRAIEALHENSKKG